jgi:hypothetical protein
MLSRLGLVIHWLAFVLGDIYILVALYNITIEGDRLSALETALGVIFLLGLYGLGWVTNFILADHKSPLPWVQNSENGG